MRTFACNFSLAKGSPSNPLPYRDNRSAMVIAESLAAAVAMLVAKYPDAEIHNINHTGTKEIIQ